MPSRHRPRPVLGPVPLQHLTARSRRVASMKLATRLDSARLRSSGHFRTPGQTGRGDGSPLSTARRCSPALPALPQASSGASLSSAPDRSLKSSGQYETGHSTGLGGPQRRVATFVHPVRTGAEMGPHCQRLGRVRLPARHCPGPVPLQQLTARSRRVASMKLATRLDSARLRSSGHFRTPGQNRRRDGSPPSGVRVLDDPPRGVGDDSVEHAPPGTYGR